MWTDTLHCPHGQITVTRFEQKDAPSTMLAWRHATEVLEADSGCTCLTAFLDVYDAQRQASAWPPE